MDFGEGGCSGNDAGAGFLEARKETKKTEHQASKHPITVKPVTARLGFLQLQLRGYCSLDC